MGAVTTKKMARAKTMHMHNSEDTANRKEFYKIHVQMISEKTSLPQSGSAALVCLSCDRCARLVDSLT